MSLLVFLSYSVGGVMAGLTLFGFHWILAEANTNSSISFFIIVLILIGIWVYNPVIGLTSTCGYFLVRKIIL